MILIILLKFSILFFDHLVYNDCSQTSSLYNVVFLYPVFLLFPCFLYFYVLFHKMLQRILFDAIICRIRKIKTSHFQPCYNGNNFFYYCYNKDSRGSGMEDPRIISALFIFLKMAYYNVLINNKISFLFLYALPDSFFLLFLSLYSRFLK